MKLPSLFIILLFTLAAFAEDYPRTIVTKDNQTYKGAIISGTDEGFATITYDDGVVRVPLSKLPDDIQLKLGCMSKEDLARLEAQKAEQLKAQQLQQQQLQQKRDTEQAQALLAAKQAELQKQPPQQNNPQSDLQKESPEQNAQDKLALAQEQKRKIAFNAITNATQTEANAYYKMPEAKLMAKFGAPIKTIQGQDSHGEKYEILVYDESKETSTHFIIYEGKGYVDTGFFKGKAINNPKAQKRLDEAKAH